MNKNIYATLFLAVFFTACAPIYDMKVSFDEETKIINIDTLELKNARVSYDKSKNDEGSHTKQVKYYLADSQCESMYFYDRKLAKGWYITENEEDYLMSRAIEKKKLKCKVEKISNIKFIRCEDVYTFKDDFTITTSKTSEDGYSSVTVIDQINKKCFNAIKTHFTKKAQEDDVIIEKYSFGENIK